MAVPSNRYPLGKTTPPRLTITKSDAGRRTGGLGTDVIVPTARGSRCHEDPGGRVDGRCGLGGVEMDESPQVIIVFLVDRAGMG